MTRVRMRQSIYRYHSTPEGQLVATLSLAKGHEYTILRHRDVGIKTVMDEQRRAQIVLVPFEAVVLL